MHFARLLVDRGKIDEALTKSNESIKIWAATLPASSPPRRRRMPSTPTRWSMLGKSREAAAELEAAVPILLKARGADDPMVRRAQGWLKAAHPDPVQTASTAAAAH